MDKPLDFQREKIDLEQIDGLISAAGVDGAREILNAYWRSTGELIDALAAQIQDQAFDLAANTAHAIKGASANVGAAGVADAAGRLEQACKTGDEGLAPQLLGLTRDELNDAQSVLEAHLKKAG